MTLLSMRVDRTQNIDLFLCHRPVYPVYFAFILRPGVAGGSPLLIAPRLDLDWQPPVLIK